jgi:hypothetical protein
LVGNLGYAIATFCGLAFHQLLLVSSISKWWRRRGMWFDEHHFCRNTARIVLNNLSKPCPSFTTSYE